MSNKKLYVGNLNFKSTEDDLRDLFGGFGEVENVTLVRDNMTGRARGFGFVEMTTEEAASKAMEALKGQPFQERNLTIDWARPFEAGAKRGGDRPRRDFSDNRRGGGGGGYGGGGSRRY